MPTVSIITLTYNTAKDILPCLHSVVKYSQTISYEIIVVDNKSPDNSAELVAKHFPGVILIRSPQNLGFAGGNNLGASYAWGKYLFFINADTVWERDVLSDLVAFWEGNSQRLSLGAVGLMLQDPQHRLMHSYTTFKTANGLLRTRWRQLASKALGKKRKHHAPPMPVGAYQEVEAVTGADLFTTKKIFDQLGGFPTEYFMYSEDLDLQFQMAQRGLKRVVLAQTGIVHNESQSTKTSQYKRLLLVSSYIRFIRKYRGPWAAWWLKLGYAWSVPVEVIVDLWRKEYSWREHAVFLKTLLGV